MEIVTSAVSARSISVRFTRKLVQDWTDSCNAFLQWQRQEVIKHKPTPEKLSEHRDTLKLMLRLGHNLYAQVSDPDFPLRQLATEVAGKLRQLEKSWEMIHHPLGDAEAEAILQQVFPG
ncbi:MAG: hypothetical protein HY735_07470 [Verrucomicrobia bacterium]|nr:hypothetical protein [Verrucomicrobiota bacterium]